MKSYRIAAVAVALTLVAGCAATRTPSPGPVRVTPPNPRPAHVDDPADLSELEPEPPCNPLASFRPTEPLPPPGQMPERSTMRRIQDQGFLRVGVDQNAYPFGYRDVATGELRGFDVDVAREMARAIFGDPNRVHFRVVTTAQAIPAIQNGDVDMDVRTLSMSCGRWQDVSFSSEYFSTAQRVLVPANSPVEAIGDLSGQKVCATKGSTSLRHLADLVPHPVPVAVDGWTDCLLMLRDGQVDAVSTDTTILAGLLTQYPNTRILPRSMHDEPYGIAISQDSTDLVRFVNSVLDRIRADGTWRGFFDKWLTDRLPADVMDLIGPPTPPEPVYRDEP